MLDPLASAILVIDMQSKLLSVMHESEEVLKQASLLVEIGNTLGVPVVATEQYPKGLGPTEAILKNAFPREPISKTSFSAYREPKLAADLKNKGKTDIILSGIEAHICVYQTALDLITNGYRVHLVVDAISSRSPANKKIAIEKLSSHGVQLTSMEMVAFEFVKDSTHPHFKSVVNLIK